MMIKVNQLHEEEKEKKRRRRIGADTVQLSVFVHPDRCCY
jgi:hypothetical protein